MIIFHEGLPGAGKSYEAMIRHVIPALQAKRKCFVYVEGLNYEKIAEVAGLELDLVRQLLRQLNAEDMPNVYGIVEDNAFVVLDEAQNFWPTGRQKLSPEMMKFITEHRHRGLDILLMGQLMKDVHAIWRGRVSQKCVFNKLDAIGAEKKYTVTVYKAVTPEKFQKVTQSFGTYDPAKFGMYASHVSSEISTSNYKDSRATVWGSGLMKYGIPIALVVGVFAFWKIWGYFHPEPVTPSAAGAPGRAASAPAPGRPPAPEPAPKVDQVKIATLSDAVKVWNDKYRPRLNAVSYRVGSRNVLTGTIDWFDGEERLQERQTVAQLERQGVQVVIGDGSALVGGMLVTAWRPLEPRKPPYGASLENGQPATTSGKSGLP